MTLLARAPGTVPTICFIATNHGVPWGASEYLWAGAAGKLAARGDVEVVVCVREWSVDVPSVAALQRAGCTVLVRPIEDDDRAFYTYQVPKDVAQEVAGRRPDLVVISQGDNREGFPWMEFCAEQKFPYLTLAHRASEWDWPDSGIIRRLRDAYLAARASHFVSMHNWRLTERMICVPLVRAAVVRNPFNVDYAGPIPWPTASERLRLACVARLDLESKAHDVLFEVLAQPKWRRRPIQIDLVGREGPHGQLLHELREFLQLEHVCFRASVDDVRSVWAECHGLVLPSRKEGLPVAIVEAMLCGRPCVVTDVGGACEVIHQGRSGWVAKSPTVEAFDQALESAWAARYDWKPMGLYAARQIRSFVPADPAAVYADVLIDHL